MVEMLPGQSSFEDNGFNVINQIDQAALTASLLGASPSKTYAKLSCWLASITILQKPSLKLILE
jgi:hypothetical protein